MTDNLDNKTNLPITPKPAKGRPRAKKTTIQEELPVVQMIEKDAIKEPSIAKKSRKNEQKKESPKINFDSFPIEGTRSEYLAWHPGSSIKHESKNIEHTEYKNNEVNKNKNIEHTEDKNTEHNVNMNSENRNYSSNIPILENNQTSFSDNLRRHNTQTSNQSENRNFGHNSMSRSKNYRNRRLYNNNRGQNISSISEDNMSNENYNLAKSSQTTEEYTEKIDNFDNLQANSSQNNRQTVYSTDFDGNSLDEKERNPEKRNFTENFRRNSNNQRHNNNRGNRDQNSHAIVDNRENYESRNRRNNNDQRTNRNNDRQNRQNFSHDNRQNFSQENRQNFPKENRQNFSQERRSQNDQKDKNNSRNKQQINWGSLPRWDVLYSIQNLQTFYQENFDENLTPVVFNEFYDLILPSLIEKMKEFGISSNNNYRRNLLRDLLQLSFEQKKPVIVDGILENYQGESILVYSHDNYQIKEFSTFVPKILVQNFALKRGQSIKTLVCPPRANESCPCAIRILEINGKSPDASKNLCKFSDLTPYYPTQRILLEHNSPQKAGDWDNLSMRVIDLLTPLGLGQRGLIVAAPRTGKTTLLQNIAHSITLNKPDAHLIILLIDERPEEVTDFRRKIKNAEIISSTFDESPENHIHSAEMTIEKARRMVENGEHVIILLDSITRLSRAYNTFMPNSGKILSGGVEANALQGPKRFFGSARNIEKGGSLTILATALVETGSKMDDVIFEEFKGTGNMELHLDRSLVEKRVFPAISIEKSGTRKEELLYHPDEMTKIYRFRRAIQGMPSTEGLELLIQRLKKTKTNTEFLIGING